MEYAVCVVPAVAVRKKPSHKVEMVNQLLFGETMRVLTEKNKWLKVQSTHDNYEGWARNNLVAEHEKNPPGIFLVTGEMINTIIFNSSKMLIPAGSGLPALHAGEGQLGKWKYHFKGIVINREETKPSESLVVQLTMSWLNAPYLWGGRTPLGVDCSGFVQVVYKMMGIDLLRNAREQIGQGMKIKKLEDTKCGDLVFFENTRGKITHVGILLNPSQVIHASGKVRVDAIDKKGITNGDTGKRTHSLAGIRRYW